jgi:hypothetical protein
LSWTRRVKGWATGWSFVEVEKNTNDAKEPGGAF